MSQEGHTLKARLHPHWAGGNSGYLYSVIFNGKLLIERSRDPEFDEKVAGYQTVRRDVGAATSPRGRRGPIAHSRNSGCLKERTILGHASSPKRRRDATAGFGFFIFGNSGRCFRNPICPGYASTRPGETPLIGLPSSPATYAGLQPIVRTALQLTAMRSSFSGCLTQVRPTVRSVRTKVIFVILLLGVARYRRLQSA
jgi:hypothetical protein